MYEYLNRRYALALYKIGEEKGKVEEYLEQLKQVVSIIEANSAFVEIIKDPEISTLEKKNMFTDVFKDKIDDDVFSFLLILIEKGRINDIGGKLREMENIYLEKHDTVVAKVKTVIPLTDDERKTLKDKLEKKFNKKVLIKSELDPSIIGGVYINIDNQVMDGTIKSKLSEMKKIMLRKD
ncbi:MAG: F0F1 ATP synthase subunit delta [Clostridium sp.]|jgi:F-type H+-transporting ATPase subunit delta|uniref:F0F1 ATP synthase subunit delta n=1 Tax=Clostridium sp. TaxID=1506 RepID=UPI0025BD9406|nr:F0F1 ATP synthase subunit delta [Clostridium sp.]MCH3965289.1 F0F1 ATP synthase subunit delta [Clostridium sp.]MCI1714510.1 F0F1 ATP synthase subunit delta [Clostridium sp.]MCI1798772.1 F0F1 ATP synthase subunit delta [Clostridium sp.]MCI1812497.1 F0F1 ATP synthase subunit delta [Clostridium sp.]MCI1869582.1 F0F1 ATP synthase subunit delta [Clostridium sp.]